MANVEDIQNVPVVNAGVSVVTYATMPWGVGVRVSSCMEAIRTVKHLHYAPADWWNPRTWFSSRVLGWDCGTEYRVTLPGKGQEFYERVMREQGEVASATAGEPIKAGDAVVLHEGKACVIPRHVWGDSEVRAKSEQAIARDEANER